MASNYYNATYCGETSRHLCTLVAEHNGRSARTNLVLTSPPHSNIRAHSSISNHPLLDSNFEIAVNKSDLKLAESICIHKYKPNLNNTNSSTPLNILL